MPIAESDWAQLNTCKTILLLLRLASAATIAPTTIPHCI